MTDAKEILKKHLGPARMEDAVNRLAGMIENGQLLAATDPVTFLHTVADKLSALGDVDLHDIGELVGIMIWSMRLAEATLENEEGCEYHDKSVEERRWMASKRLGDGLSAAGNLVKRIEKYIPDHYLETKKVINHD